VTALFILFYLSSDVQGYYYTFNSILALQALSELGMGTVIKQFAAHEWSRLGFDRRGTIVGDSEALSRIVSLGRLASIWFAIGGAIIGIGVAAGGYAFFAMSTQYGVDWVGPWFVFCTLSGIKVSMLPLWSLLEGCNQVSRVYALRMMEGTLRSLVIWAAMALGAGLWAPAISLAAGLLLGVLFLVWYYLPFLRTFFRSARGPRLSWRFEIWPMQWRMAVGSICSYFGPPSFTLILFHYQGAIVAGQMGISYGIILALASLSLTWVSTKAPLFGILIAKKEYASLDRLFFRVAGVSIGVRIVGSFIIWVSVYLLRAINPPFAERFLAPLPLGFLLLAYVAIGFGEPMSVYLRAHRQEPYFGLSVIGSLLAGLFAWLLGSQFGATGIATGFLVVAVVTTPFAIIIWLRCRSAWHSDSPKTSTASSVI
jgi:hypothetical protein